MPAKESRNRNSADITFGAIFRDSNCFQRIKQRLNNYFSPSQAICAWTEITDLV
jgi:hypothetical protein